LESEDFTVEGSVVVLAPGHTVTGFFWVDLSQVHDSENFADIVFVGDFGFLDAFWEVWVWVPFSFGTTVKVGHWDWGSKLEAGVAGWIASEKTISVFALNYSVDWSVQVLALLGVADARWEPVTASWETWLVNTGIEVADKQVGGFGSVASFAGQSANFDAFVDLARNGTVDWVEGVAGVGSSWNEYTSVAGFLFNSGHRTGFLWHESASTVDFELVTGAVFSDENFGGPDFDGNGFMVAEFGNDFFRSISFDSFDESSNFIVVSQSNRDFLTFGRTSPEWDGWADSSPGIGEFSDVGDSVSVAVGDIVFGVSVEASADTGGGEVELSSDQQSVFVKNESSLFNEINNNNSIVLSVDFEGGREFDWFDGFVETVGSSVEDESGRVALSVSKSQPTSLFTAGVDDIVRASTVVVETELVDVESFGRFQQSHLTVGSFVAKELSIERFVPFTFGPNDTRIVPILVGWKGWRLNSWGGESEAFWVGITWTGIGTFDFTANSVYTPAVVFCIALEWGESSG
jgi:hypothetical protein